jgi:hypothetical protein
MKGIKVSYVSASPSQLSCIKEEAR